MSTVLIALAIWMCASVAFAAAWALSRPEAVPVTSAPDVDRARAAQQFAASA